MLGRSNVWLFTPTIDPKTGDGILYCDRCGQKEHRYRLHAITLVTERKAHGQWVGQFRITLLGKETTALCSAHASGTFDNRDAAEAAGLAAAKAWLDSQGQEETR